MTRYAMSFIGDGGREGAPSFPARFASLYARNAADPIDADLSFAISAFADTVRSRHRAGIRPVSGDAAARRLAELEARYEAAITAASGL